MLSCAHAPAQAETYTFRRHPIVIKLLPKLHRLMRAELRDSERGFMEAVLLTTNEAGLSWLGKREVARRIGRRPLRPGEHRRPFCGKTMDRAADRLHELGFLDWDVVPPLGHFPNGVQTESGARIWKPDLQAIAVYLDALSRRRQSRKSTAAQTAKSTSRADTGDGGGTDMDVVPSESRFPSESSKSFPEGKLSASPVGDHAAAPSAPRESPNALRAGTEASETPGSRRFAAREQARAPALREPDAPLGAARDARGGQEHEPGQGSVVVDMLPRFLRGQPEAHATAPPVEAERWAQEALRRIGAAGRSEEP